jgi:F-type H+-transporting ATPase subunit b
MQADWQASLQSKQNLFLNRLRQQVIQHTAGMTRKILQEITNEELESQAVIQFIQRLQQLQRLEQQQLLDSIQTTPEPLLIRSGLELSLEDQTKIVEALQHQLNLGNVLYLPANHQEEEQLDENPTEVKFITVADLICGIELQVGGYELSWSFDHELQQLNQQLSQVIQHEIERSY